jgi:hypothetical protein
MTIQGALRMDTPLSLEEQSKKVPLEISLKEVLAKETMGLLKVSLLATLGISIFVFVSDAVCLYNKIYTAEYRIFTTEILKILIGATVVQVGAAFTTIAVAIFKGE